MSDDEIFGFLNDWDDESEEVEGGEFGEDCPDHLEHTAIMENDDD